MSSAELKTFIDNAKSSGMSDIKIFLSIMDSPKFSKGVKKGNEMGMDNRQIAAGLGLNISRAAADPNAEAQKEVKRQAKVAGPTKAWESALLGASDLGAGILQGASYAADGVSGGLNKLLGTNLDTKSYERVTKARKDVSDFHNLRRQENNQGFDGLRLAGQVAATAPLGAAARGYQGAKVLSAAGAKVAAQNAGVGALIGGAQFAENAKQRAGNTILGGVGGAVGGALGEKVGQGVNKLSKRVLPSQQATSGQIDQTIEITLNQADEVGGKAGIKLSDLPTQVQNQLRAEVKKLMQQGRKPDAQTLQRLSVFKDLKQKGFDLKPTAKQATGNAQLWTKESNLSKLEGAEKLAKKYSQDHVMLKDLLDDFEVKTGGTMSDEYQVGDELFKSLRSQDQGRNDYIAAMYNQAKNHTGNDLLLDGGRFAANMKASLDEDLVDSSLVPAPLWKKVEAFANGDKPFTLAEKEILVKQINSRMSGADSQTRFALQSVRNALEREVDASLEAFGDTLNTGAKLAWDDARKAASGRFGLIDRTPALQKALADAEPDKAFDQLVWRGNVRELESLVKEIQHNPEVLNGVRQAVVKRISDKSIGVAGNFSPKAMSDSLKAIGDRKLSLLFSPEEIRHLKNIDLAGRYLISQPPGSNVNNSNTASALMNHLSSFSKLPVIKDVVNRWVVPPVRGVNAQIKINQGSNALSKTAQAVPQAPADLSLIEKLVKAGVISGANISNE